MTENISQWSHSRFLFAHGCPEESRIWLLAQDQGKFRMLQRKEDKWVQRALPWDAVALCGITRPQLLLLIVGVDGDAMTASPAGFVPEKITTPESEPSRLGMLRGARYIGGLPHVVGMGRQVYRREADGQWTSLAHTIKPPPKTVKGFHSIDGFSSDHLLAVGLDGEIWRCRAGSWEQLDSPTNVSLNEVRCLPGGTAYACGQAGMLLRIKEQAVDVMAGGKTDANLYGMALFNGDLYVASQTQIFKLNPDHSLSELAPHLGETFTSGQLEAWGDTLWSIGAHHVATSTDGVTWTLQVCPL
jgi:hypothetical protein